MAARAPVGDPRPGSAHTEEELAVQRVWLERAVALGFDYFSPVYHTHSIYLSGPDCRIVEMLRHVRT